MTENDDVVVSDDDVVVSGDTLSLEKHGNKVIVTLVHDSEDDAATTFETMKKRLDDGLLTVSLSIEREGRMQ